MISFGHPRLTFNISMAFTRHDCRLWICARANFAHAFLCRCFDKTVPLKQSAYRNRGLFLGRYCDVSSYNFCSHSFCNIVSDWTSQQNSTVDLVLTLISEVPESTTAIMVGIKIHLFLLATCLYLKEILA